MAKPLGLRNDITIRSISEKSTAHFVLIVVIAALPAFIEGLDGSLFAFAAPYIVQNIHASTAMLGVLATGYAIGLCLFSLLGGFLFNKFSVKYTILSSVALFSVFTVVSGFAGNVITLVLSRLLVGLGIGMFQPAIIALLGDIFPETRGRTVSVFNVTYGAGIFVAPYTISPFLPHFRIPFVITGILAGFVILAFYLVIPKTHKNIEKQHSISIKGIMNKNVCVLSISNLFYGITLFGFLAFYSEYLLKELLIHPVQAGTISAMVGLGGALGSYPLGVLADKFGRKRIVILSAFLVLLASVGMFGVGQSIALLCISTFLFGLGIGFPAFVAAQGQDSVSEHLAGVVTGWLFFAFLGGGILGGPLFAAFLPMGFTKAGLLTLGVSSLLSFVFTLFTNREIQTSAESKYILTSNR